MTSSFTQLLDFLERSGRVKAGRAQRILDEEPQWSEAPEQMLVQKKLISREDLLAAKSEMMKVPALALDPTQLDPAIVGILPQAMAHRYNCVCVSRDGDTIVVAMVDPHDAFALDYIRMRTGYTLDLRVAYAGDVHTVVQKLYAGVSPGRAPASMRERFGQEIVKTRSVTDHPIARPRVLSVTHDLTETPVREAPHVPRIRLGEHRVSLTAEPETDRRAVDLARLSLDLISVLDENVLIDRILDTAMRLFRIEAASLLLIDWEHSQLFFREARGPHNRELRNMALPLDPTRSVAAWCVANRQPVNIKDTAEDPRHNKEIDRQFGYHTKTLLAAPVIWGNDVLGVIELLNRADGPFNEHDVEYAVILAAQVALALHNTMSMHQLHNFYQQSLETLIDCYQAFDPVSRGHVLSVASLATAMGRTLELSATEMETLTYAGLLHDIGKIRCTEPDDPSHVEHGAGMLGQVTLFQRLVPVVRHHHERWDGGGFPEALKGEAIPQLARIMAVAEAWCEEGLERIRGGAAPQETSERFLSRFGTDFDPALRGPFLENMALAMP